MNLLRFTRSETVRIPALGIRLRGGIEVAEPVTLIFAKADTEAAWGGEKKQQHFAKMYSDEGGSYRWITVHPHGEDEKGVPVKIRESKTSPGTWHVVGGAGGKLNYLRLTGVKTPEEYRKQAFEKRAVREAKKKAKQESERERKGGLTEEEKSAESKAKAAAAAGRQEQRVAQRVEEQELIARVAKHAGWDEKEWQFDAERLKKAGASEKRILQLEHAHHKRVLARSRAILDDSKAAVVAKRADELKDIPLHPDDPSKVGLEDILDGPETPRGKGFISPTRKLSDKEVTKTVMQRDRGRLEREADHLADNMNRQRDQRGEVDPETKAAFDQVAGELKMQQLVEEAARTAPEVRAKEKEAVNVNLTKTLKEAKDAREAAAEALQKAEKDEPLTDEEGDKMAALNEKLRETERLRDRRDDLDIMEHGSAAPAIKPEAKAVTISKREMRAREIAADPEKGPEAADLYKMRVEQMQKALAKYRAEVKFYKDTGTLQTPTKSLETGAKVKDADEVLKLLAADKALKRRARAIAEAEVKETDVDERLYGKPAFTPTGAVDPRALADTRKEIERSVETALTQSFLERIESPDLLLGRGGRMVEDYDRRDLHRALEKHLSAGTYNVVNNAALSTLKDATLSREVVDVLGPKGAAQLLARAIHEREGAAIARSLGDKLGEYHVAKNVLEAGERLREVEQALDDSDQAMHAAVSNPGDLAVATAANRERAAKLEDARQIAGQALGEYEATAALVESLGQRPTDRIDINMGPIGTEAAVRQLRSLGLDKEHYTITSDGVNHLATIKEAGFSKLMRPPDKERERITEEVLAIKRGDRDDLHWVPKGAAVRTSTSFSESGHEPPPLAATGRAFNQMTEPAHLEEHIARRLADGEDINNILPDVFSQLQSAPTAAHKALFKTLNQHFPPSIPATKPDGTPVYVTDRATGQPKLDAAGKPVQAMRAVKGDAHQAAATALVEKYFRDQGHGEFAPIHAQRIDLENTDTHEALVRAIAPDPRTMVAFTPLGDLTSQDQRALRSYFASEVAKPAKVTTALDAGLKDLGPEPEHDVKEGGLFGGPITNPEWTNWKSARDKLYEDTHFDPVGGAKTNAWGEYVSTMGGVRAAYSALQDHMKGRVVGTFHQAYTNLTGDKLRLGVRQLAHAELHAGYKDPAERERLLAKRREMIDALRYRTRGKYAAGAISERIERAQQAEEIARQQQSSMLLPTDAKADARKPKEHERHFLGDTVEGQIRSLMPNLAKQFQPGSAKTNFLKDKNYAGQFIHQQRSIKAFEASKRMAAALGTGSGKTSIMINAHTHLKGQGKVKRALYVVPAGVVEQFGPEFVRFADPKALTWAANPGAPREQRLAEHADAGSDAVVHSHQSFRDDMVHLLAKGWGIPEKAATERFMKLDRKEAGTTLRDVLKKEGISYDMLAIDEGHGLLDRQGKPDSILSRVSQALSDHTPYYMSSTADPVKNDVSELRSLMDKLNPGHGYDDADAWNRRYGVNTSAASEALKREVSPFVYAAHIHIPNKITKRREVVPLTPQQQARYDAVHGAYERLRAARIAGSVDVESAKVLAPERFKDAPADQHEAIAKNVMRAAGTMRETRLQDVVDSHDAGENAKMLKLRDIAKESNRTDKPLVVFAHRLEAVRKIAADLEKQGYSVDTYMGPDSQQERGKKRRAFQEEGKTQVLVLSDAGSTGLNLQRGQTVVQFDRPWTAMTHAQRNGRIDRLGQNHSEIELIDLQSDTPFEHRAQERIDKKYDLRGVLTDPAETLDDSGIAGLLKQARAEASVKEARTGTRMPVADHPGGGGARRPPMRAPLGALGAG